MANPKKRPVDEPEIEDHRALRERLVAEHLAIPVPDRASNFDAMCEAVTGSGERSVRCRKCGGKGFRKMETPQLEAWKRKIATTPDPFARAKLVEDFQRASDCSACRTTGFRTTTSSVQRTECADCNGRRVDAAGNPCRACNGAGTWSLGRPDGHRWNTVRCWRCQGRVMAADAPGPRCPVCNGGGHTIPVTVWETGCSKKGKLPPGTEPAHPLPPGSAAGRLWGTDSTSDEDAAAALAAAKERRRVQGMLEWVAARDPLAGEALEAYLGEIGDRWAKVLYRGRVFAVAHLTDAGRELLGPEYDAARIRGLTSLVRPHDRLDALRHEEARAAVPNIPVRLLLTDMDEQCRELLERAQELLGEASDE